MTCLHRRSAATAVNAPGRWRLVLVAGCSAVLLLLGTTQSTLAQAEAGDAEWGAYLASECVVCHQPSGDTPGIPKIVRLSTTEFLAAMTAYKQRIRPDPGMQLIAASLSADEIAALAAYFATLSPESGAIEGLRP